MKICKLVVILALFSLISCASHIIGRECEKIGKDAKGKTLYKCEEVE